MLASIHSARGVAIHGLLAFVRVAARLRHEVARLWRAGSVQSIRAHLTVCVLLSLLPLIAFSNIAFRAFGLADSIELRAQVTTKTKSIHDRLAGELDHMRILGHYLAAVEPLFREDPARLHAIIMAAKAVDATLHTLVAEPSGQQIVNTRAPLGIALPHVRPAILERVLSERRTAVVSITQGKVAGVPVFNVVVPVIRNGTVERIIAMNRNATILTSLLASHPLPAGWAAALLDRDNNLLAGRPLDATALALPGSLEADVVATMLSEDGEMLTSYLRERFSGWTVVVVAPVGTHSLMGPSRWSWLAGLQVIAVLLSLGIAWLTARRIARPIAELEVATHRLAADPGYQMPTFGITEIRNVADALARSTAVSVRRRERLSAVLMSASDAIICVDRSGHVTLINDAATRMFGHTRDAARHQSLHDLLSVAPADQGRHITAVEPLQLEDRAVTQCVGVRADGDQFAAEVTIARSTADDDYYATMIIRDVTERRRIEAEHARLAVIVKSSGDAIYSLSLDLTVMTWNAAAERLFGYTADEMIGKSYLDLVPDEEKETAVAISQKLLTTTSLVVTTWRLHKDGHRIPVEVTTAPFRNAAGTVVGVSSVMRDITERHKSAIMSNHLAAIVASSIDAIVSLEPNGIITSWNTAAETLFGYSAAEAIGKTSKMLLPPDQHHMIATWREIFANSGMIRIEGERLRKNGTRVQVAVTGMAIVGPNGEAKSLALIYRDITESKRHEQQMSIVMRELSHRAKNLLAVIAAMARSTASTAIDLSSFEESFSARIQGLARSHDLLVKRSWTGVPLRQLVEAQLLSFTVRQSERLAIHGDDITLNPAAGQMVGLALHELATNAAKYGAFKTVTGRVTVTWSIETATVGAAQLVLIWTETGGPPVVNSASSGFGREVLETMLAESLNGTATLTFTATGVTWRMAAPLNVLLVDPISANAPCAQAETCQVTGVTSGAVPCGT